MHASGHRVLDHVGGVMSPEMEIPKLMWLKRHLPESWARAGLFLDLADYLTWRASGSTARSRVHAHLQMDLSRPRDAGLAAATSSTAMGIADLLERGGLPERASPIGSDLGPLTARVGGRAGPDHRLPGRRRA